MNVDIPEGKDAIEYVWGEMVPGIGIAASNFSLSVYAHTTLGLREFEAARLRIAQIGGCLFCLDRRTERDGVKVEEDFADAVTQGRTTDVFGLPCRFRGSLTWADMQNTPYPGYVSTCDGTKR
ncbi:hypothetical protein AB0I23_35810, partial [Streptomyces atratus]